MGGGVKEELHTKGVNNRTGVLQWVWWLGATARAVWVWRTVVVDGG